MRSPRFELIAVWIGFSTCSSTKTSAEGAERTGEVVAPLDGSDHHAGADGQQGGEHAAQHEHGPPERRQPTVGGRDHPGEAPLLAGAQAAQHDAAPGMGGWERSTHPVSSRGATSVLDEWDEPPVRPGGAAQRAAEATATRSRTTRRSVAAAARGAPRSAATSAPS